MPSLHEQAKELRDSEMHPRNAADQLYLTDYIKNLAAEEMNVKLTYGEAAQIAGFAEQTWYLAKIALILEGKLG